MPVITTVSTVGIVTTTTYQVDVDVSRPKTASKIRAIRTSTGGTFYFTALNKNSRARIRFYKDVALSNTGPSTINPGVFPCAADYWTLPFSIPKVLFNVTTLGNQVGNTVLCTHYENPTEVSGNTISQNVYVIKFPSVFPDDTCIEADLGYPFGTVHIISGAAGSNIRVTAASPPSGWVRNKERRNWSGYISNRAYQVRALGSQVFYQGDSVSDVIDAYRMGFSPSSLPAFTLGYALNTGAGTLLGFNYQTSTVMRSNLTFNARWRGMDYKTSANPLHIGAYIGSPFALAFTDTSPGTAIVTLKATLGQALSAPAIPAGKYSCLYLEATATSDCVDASGVPFTTTETTIYLGGNYGNTGGGGSILNWTMGPPSYYPWDIKLRSYGTDDATVRYVRHAGYIPPAASFPAELADTVAAPILSRSGKFIILQGGWDRYPISSRNPTASTPPITAFAASVDPAATSFSGGYIRIRIVSKIYSAEWSTIAGLTSQQEFTTASGGTGTGIYRQVVARYFDAVTYYEGPAVYLSDICLLTNTANGVQGNVEIAPASSIINADSQTGFDGFPGALVRGMLNGSPSAAATGTIQMISVPLFGNTLTIGDGTIKKVFEFGRSFKGSIGVSIGSDVDACNANLIAAINASGLAINASIPVITDWQAEVTLLHTRDQAGGSRTTGNSWTVAVP